MTPKGHRVIRGRCDLLSDPKGHGDIFGRLANRSRCPTGNPMVAGLIPGGDIYFHFEFFACFPSLQLGGAIANEIKHDHSPVIIAVLDPRYD